MFYEGTLLVEGELTAENVNKALLDLLNKINNLADAANIINMNIDGSQGPGNGGEAEVARTAFYAE